MRYRIVKAVHAICSREWLYDFIQMNRHRASLNISLKKLCRGSWWSVNSWSKPSSLCRRFAHMIGYHQMIVIVINHQQLPIVLKPLEKKPNDGRLCSKLDEPESASCVCMVREIASNVSFNQIWCEAEAPSRILNDTVMSLLLQN